MTITEELDAINDKLAGSDQPSAQTIAEELHLLLENIGNGGGSGTFKVTVTETDGTYSADKTVEEVLEAFEAGQMPVTVCDIDGEYWYCTLCFNTYVNDETDRELYFTGSTCTGSAGGVITMTTVRMSSGGVSVSQVNK